MEPSPVVVALVLAILIDDPDSSSDGPVTETALVLERKIAGMPTVARVGMGGLIVFFDWWGVLRSGRPFQHQTSAQQHAQLTAWTSSPVGLFRDFVSFFRRMGVFAWYSLGHEE